MPDTPATVTSVCQHFKKCMEAFSRQEAVHKLLANGNPYIFSRDKHSQKYTVVDGHPLLKGDYPQAVWSVEILAKEFLRCYSQYQTFSEEVCREIRKNMAIRLTEHFEVVLPGIDLDVITAIGGERYESAAGTGLSMTMIPTPLTPDHLKKLGIKGTAIFEPNAWLRLSFENIHSLRKQLNMAKDASLAVCYMKGGEIDVQKEGLYSVGILPAQIKDVFPHIYFTGHMEWCFCVPPEQANDAGDAVKTTEEVVQQILPGSNRSDEECCPPAGARARMKERCRLRYKQGHLLIPEICPTKIYWENLSVGQARRENILKLISLAQVQKKGAILIVSDTGLIQQECNRLCLKFSRGLRFQDKISLFADAGKAMRQYTSIDGAAFADFDGNCYACGVILDGEAVEIGNLGRGARYNSTANYLKVLRNAHRGSEIVGIVVSEDGMVDILD